MKELRLFRFPSPTTVLGTSTKSVVIRVCRFVRGVVGEGVVHVSLLGHPAKNTARRYSCVLYSSVLYSCTTMSISEWVRLDQEVLATLLPRSDLMPPKPSRRKLNK